VAKATTKELVTGASTVSSIDLKAPVDVLVAPQRLDPIVKEVRTGQTIEIPAGGAVLFSLAPRMLKTPIRLVENFILNRTAAPVKQPIVLLVDNTGMDGFFLTKGAVIATAVILNPVDGPKEPPQVVSPAAE
jgi:hypothetical protein